jgi:hypothetical protein
MSDKTSTSGFEKTDGENYIKNILTNCKKTNNAHDVTMTSNTYRVCWKQVLTSTVWSRL